MPRIHEVMDLYICRQQKMEHAQRPSGDSLDIPSTTRSERKRLKPPRKQELLSLHLFGEGIEQAILSNPPRSFGELEQRLKEAADSMEKKKRHAPDPRWTAQSKNSSIKERASHEPQMAPKEDKMRSKYAGQYIDTHGEEQGMQLKRLLPDTQTGQKRPMSCG